MQRKCERMKGAPAVDLIFNHFEHPWGLLPMPTPGAVPESVEHGLRVWDIGTLVPGQVKPMTYKIDICHFLAWYLPLIG